MKTKRPHNNVCHLEMPVRPLELDGPKGPKRTVACLLMRNSLFIRDHDLPWLLRYMVEELQHGGVPICKEETDVPEANTGVPTLFIAWDLSVDPAWLGEFVDGPLTGTRIRSSIANRTQQKWDFLRSYHYDMGDCAQATVADKTCRGLAPQQDPQLDAARQSLQALTAVAVMGEAAHL